jgi:IS1 family transposase
MPNKRDAEADDPNVNAFRIVQQATAEDEDEEQPDPEPPPEKPEKNPAAVQCDEIWAFCGAKEKNVPLAEKGRGKGDVWTWTGIDRDSKLVIAYKVGERTSVDERAFVRDLADRLANRVQLSTDGLGHYKRAVEEAFGWAKVDFAMLERRHRTARDA